MIDKNAIKNSLTIEQVYDIVEQFGADPILQNNIIMMDTVCHNHPGEATGKKLYYYDNTKLFKCFTECDDTFDIFDLTCKVKLIQEQEEWNMMRAVYYIANFFNLEIKRNDCAFGQNYSDVEEYFRLKKYLATTPCKKDYHYEIYQNTLIRNLLFVPSLDWLQEGITVDTMKRYNIRYYGTSHKIVIPHYDIDNNLIGIRGRALSAQDEEYGKYMPLKVGNVLYTHSLAHNLYGLNFNKNNIQKTKKIILVEAEKSVLLYDSFFGKENNIMAATCGHSISDYQIELIKHLEVNEVIIAYDKQFKELGDEEYYKDTELLLRLSRKLKPFFSVSIVFDKFNLLDYKDAPIDKGKEIFQFLFENRIIL